MDSERANGLIWLFYHDSTISSVPELAKRVGVLVREAYSVLKDEGYSVLAADGRYYETAVLAKLGITNQKLAPRCIDCEILLIEDDRDSLPEGWKRGINARVGDLCASCYGEMKKEDKERFEALVKMGCIVCQLEHGQYTAPEIHHIRRLGEYREHQRTIPLCPDHHRTGDHGMARHSGKKEWERRHGTEEFLLNIVNIELEKK